MKLDKAQALRVSLEAVIHSLDVPTHIAATIDDVSLKQMIGSLTAEVVSKIDHEILPYLSKQFPDLKTDTGES